VHIHYDPLPFHSHDATGPEAAPQPPVSGPMLKTSKGESVIRFFLKEGTSPESFAEFVAALEQTGFRTALYQFDGQPSVLEIAGPKASVLTVAAMFHGGAK